MISTSYGECFSGAAVRRRIILVPGADWQVCTVLGGWPRIVSLAFKKDTVLVSISPIVQANLELVEAYKYNFVPKCPCAAVW